MSRKSSTLALLTHSADTFGKRPFLVQLMVPHWEAMGFRVVVVTERDDFVPADLALLHVDLSVVPEACRRLAERYPRVINGGALDIRKRRFSQLLVGRQDAYAGRCIVKTDCNHGGWGEFRQTVLESPLGSLLRWVGREERGCRLLARLETRRSWQRKRLLLVGDYPIYEKSEQVPLEVWQNPDLVVERFVAERKGSRYCCRHWLFFGRQEVTRRTVSDDPVVKFRGTVERTSEAVPEELRALRQELGFDYGKFDYGIVNGKVYLYDANRTPGGVADPAHHTATIDTLCEGIHDF